MRTGACTVQQALTTEAASVLKQALGLAKRRGHAQVTPLHVAATLLSSTREATCSLFRRACLKSHPHHPNSHPLQCRALELCFNVALNRLPTNPPPSSGSLIPTHPSLSNALIAALKRAQAHQRRGCIEQQQQQQPHQQQQQQQQPLLAIKVELEQLIISILDDPSVSRVMREAGFSSTYVKNKLEEDSSAASPSVFFDAHRDIISQSSFWQTHYLKPPIEPNPPVFSSQKEDLRLVLEVLLGKNKKRNNTVVVGDSVSYTEGLVAELMGRVERGEVPEELRSAQFIKFQLSSLHLRFMSRTDVEMKVSDLRRKVGSLISERGGVIIFVGDLKWAADEETRDVEVSGGGYRAMDHLIAEVGRLLSELRSCNNGDANSKVWLMATANYQTYMRCQMRQPSLETQWALQAVSVPSGGLALSLHSPSVQDSRVATLSQNAFQLLEPKSFHCKDEQDNLICCAECTSNFEREASMFKSGSPASSPPLFSSRETKGINSGSSNLPFWLQPHKPDNHQKDVLVELRRKWNRLCQSLKHNRHNQNHLYPPLFNQSLISKSLPNPWWSAGAHYNHNNVFAESNSISFTDFIPKSNGGNSNFLAQLRSGNGSWREKSTHKQWLSEVSLDSLKRTTTQDVRTNLALGSTMFSDSATSTDQKREVTMDRLELCLRLKENIPWQSETIHSIVETLLDHKSRPNKAKWLLLQGIDWIGKRRLSLAIAESFCGSLDRFVHVNPRKLENKAKTQAEIIVEALRKNANCVLSIEEIDHADADFLKFLAEGFETGDFKDPIGRVVSSAQAIFVLTTSSPAKFDDVGGSPDAVIKMKLQILETPTDTVPSEDLKRKAEWDSPTPNKSKNPRTRECILDLNISAGAGLDDDDDSDEEEDTVPSDLTQETDGGDLRIPHGFLGLNCARFVLDACPDRSHQMYEHFLSKLNRSFEESGSVGSLCVDRAVAAELAAASGCFLDSLFDKWLREVFQTSLPTVEKGGKVRMCVEGKEGNVLESGFQGSTLPNKIIME